MRTRLTYISLLFVTTLAGSLTAPGLELKLAVSDDSGKVRKAGTVTSGLPFARGVLKELSKLSVSTGGKNIPAQFSKLVSWDDGSVRWALLDTQLDLAAGGRTEVVVRDDGKNKMSTSPIVVRDSAAELVISTGGLKLIVSRKKPGLIQSLIVDGQEQVTTAGRGPVIYTLGEARQVQKKVGRKKYTGTEYGPGKEIVALPPSEVVVELAGPLRTVVRLRGKFPGIHNGLLSYTARLSVFAGQKFVKIHFWLENNGAFGYYYGKKDSKPVNKMEWFLFDGMALELGLAGAPKASCQGSEPASSFKLQQVCLQSKAKDKLKWNDQPIYQFKDFQYTIFNGSKLLKKGLRTDGLVELKSSVGSATVAIRNFWENYEKSIELADSRLKLWLWPTEGAWPRPQWYGNIHFYDAQLDAIFKQVQGVVRAHNICGPKIYRLQGGTHKGHEFILDFSGRTAVETHSELAKPLFALASAAYYANSGAAPIIFSPPETRSTDQECNQKLDSWMRMTMSAVDPKSKSGLIAARKDSPWNGGLCTYWYGWMDFGDITNPTGGPSGLTGDWLLVMMLNTMRTGQLGFLRMGSEMARHRIDIDQLWSDRDLPEVNGLQRAAGYSNFHCYRLWRPPGLGSNHLAGTALYYMLTGEPKALETCRRNAEGLKRAWARVAKLKSWKGPQQDMGANIFAIHSYLAMYDLSADKQWLDQALKLFRSNVVSKWKGVGPHLHSRRQVGGQSYTMDDKKYCHGILGLCLLHHYSKDKQVLELLKAGADQDFPENYFDAPLFLADLHAYVALVTGKTNYVDDAIEHWIEASAESKCPPLFLGNKNSTWHKRSVMHLRAGHLLQYYFWKKKGKFSGSK
jgi:PcRGLX-like N-terminal RIFT barrel domain/PcRGLX-like protein central beta sandwich domain